jgi:integration host factor subunit beta
VRHDQIRTYPARLGTEPAPLFARSEKVINIILGEIVAAMARGDRVELRGFGAFRVRYRAARNGRNPRNGAFIAVNQKKMPHFKPGKEMHERLNNAQE